MGNKAGAHLALVGANILFGITHSVAKQVMPDYLSPFTFVFTRIFGACLLFWLFSLMLPWQKIRKQDRPRMVLASLFGIILNKSIYLNGLNLTTPIDASIIITATPILVMVFARAILKEPVTWVKMIGIILGATGAALLILQSGEISFGNNQLIGNMMIIVNVSCYALYLIIAKPLLNRYHPVTVMKWIFLGALVPVTPFGLPGFMQTQWLSLPAGILFAILYVVVGVTFLAYLMNLYSLKYVKPVTVSIYMYSQPVVASIMAMIFAQDVLTLIKILSAILVFAGVYFVSYSGNSSGRLAGQKL